MHLSNLTTAQDLIIQGKIIDAETKKPLPFANITVNEGQRGTTSDIDGKFYLNIQGLNVRSVVFSYIGYTPFRYEVKEEADLKPLQRQMLIKLNEDRTLLPSFTIKAGENPAHRIIKAAYRNRKENDPTQIPSYAYRIYNKFYINLEEDPLQESDSLIAQTPADSNRQQLAQYLQEHHLFMAESFIEHKFIQPDFHKDVVLANRVGGLKNPRFAAIATDLQPFSFYDDYITILDKAYLNPISRGSTSKYFFAIEDTAYAQKDTVFVISFEPYPDKNFIGLKGLLYIHTGNYAIQNVLASSNDPDELIGFYIEQHYEWVENKYWFPTQLHANLTFNQMNLMGKRYVGFARSYIDSIQIRPPLKKRSFDEVTLEISDASATRDEGLWNRVRNQAISPKEQQSYDYLDSLGQANKFDRLVGLAEVLTYQYLPVKWVDFDLSKVLQGNRFEGLRIGIGAKSNHLLSERFSWGAYIAYGFKDNRLKYGFEGQVQLEKNFDVHLNLLYQDDVREPGRFSFPPNPNFSFFSSAMLREFLTLRMDRVKKFQASLNLRPIRNTFLSLGIQRRNVNPLYDYTFLQLANDGATDSLHQFRSSELSAQIHYAFGQEFAKIGSRKLFLQSAYPTLTLGYTYGANWLNADFEYHKWEAKIAHQIRWTNLGLSSLLIKAGWVRGEVPYSLLYNGLGITPRQPLVIDEFFQTMNLYEFLSDRFINIFLKHNFGQLLFRPNARFSRPELLLVQGIAFGSLNNPERHQAINFRTLESGYYESGVQINNLLRFNYLDVAYWGFGFGVYARYGAYARSKWSSNLALKLSSHFTF